ncbi:unnamed protein product [Symbiodinium necroappetens]|uniref:Uncharacterized protein n=1 Tax=Symbiodinium necroappetens TaxID=1628268 RepID=A0A812NZH4_9DINO|nr:unnamed protein product [Symbiodinium necroappetens]
MASKGDTKPGFLCPAYDPASSPVSAGRPPRPPGEDGPAESTVRSSPEPPPRAPTSARGASPSPLQRRLRPSQGTSEVSSARSSGTGASQARTPASTRPSSAGASVSAEEMLMQGYIPSTEYVGIMALNKELREQNKLLRAELVNLKVEQESLRMEESFLRSQLHAGLEPPPEVTSSLPDEQ